jgi:hypothetical protein
MALQFNVVPLHHINTYVTAIAHTVVPYASSVQRADVYDEVPSSGVDEGKVGERLRLEPCLGTQG